MALRDDVACSMIYSAPSIFAYDIPETALKKFKKPPSKRKQNGKKVSKGQASKAKQKSEMETPVKEQLSELEKEILVIEINELEGKLKRKSHMCSYMEEETSIYRALYGGKLFLKSESMKLLNEAFQDFASEIFLLDQEYKAMQCVHSSLAQRQHFCLEYQKRVDMLKALGTHLETPFLRKNKKLLFTRQCAGTWIIHSYEDPSAVNGSFNGAVNEENLLESEKCFDELPVFAKMFAELEEKATSEKEKYDFLREEILKNFDGCLGRIQNQVHVKTGNLIRDRDLKLDLLPFSWQALFCSGWLSHSWWEVSAAHLEHLHSQNRELEKKQDHLMQPSVLGLMCDREKSAVPEPAIHEEPLPDSELHQMCLYLETKNVRQQSKLKSMERDMKDLEKAIHSLEVSGESRFDTSYLIQIVHKAGGLLKREMEGPQ